MRLLAGVLVLAAAAAVHGEESALDRKARAFLERSRGDWRDLNVPWEDGQALFDVVVKNRLTRGLEIGTSTGHSTIWIAWALARNGGRLTTIEIDPGRHAAAKRNLEEAGVAHVVDARLADAHALVKQLPGPFDFVFSDADKDWYLQYFKDVDPKLVVGGCFTAHNVRRGGWGGTADFLAHVERLPNYRTTVLADGAGLSISCKTAP
jgi:predicted O-methyltransferase YrrM